MISQGELPLAASEPCHCNHRIRDCLKAPLKKPEAGDGSGGQGEHDGARLGVGACLFEDRTHYLRLTDMVMNAARAAGARGGTTIHAKGTGEKDPRFYNITLAKEKEVLGTPRCRYRRCA